MTAKSFASSRTNSVTSNSEASRLSEAMPTKVPFSQIAAALSAPPRWRMTRSPRRCPARRRSEPVMRRRCRPVGLCSGTVGGSPGNGMTTFVYWGRSPVSCMVQLPGTSIGRQPAALVVRAIVQPEGASTGESRRRNHQSESRSHHLAPAPERASSRLRWLRVEARAGRRLRLVRVGSSHQRPTTSVSA